MPNKNVLVNLTVFDFYLDKEELAKSNEYQQQNAMFELVGDTLDYIALYDRELYKGFALSNISENSVGIAIVYLRGDNGEIIDEEALIADYMTKSAREAIKAALSQAAIDKEALSLIFVDGYEDYEGTQITKLLLIRRNYKI